MASTPNDKRTKLARLLQEKSRREAARAHGALGRYAPRVYPGSAVLFRATTQTGSAAPPADLGWSAWIAGGVATHEAPGDHYTMLHAPHASVLAEQLDRHLRSAEGD
jgi:thioesterase domain-containing protein